MKRQQIPGPGQSLGSGLMPGHEDRDHFVADFFRCHSAAGFRIAGSDESRQEIFWLCAWLMRATVYQFIDCFIEFVEHGGGTTPAGKKIREPCRETDQIEQTLPHRHLVSADAAVYHVDYFIGNCG